jgi:hypothetical protein
VPIPDNRSKISRLDLRYMLNFPELTPRVPNTNASKNVNNTAYTKPFTGPNLNPGTLNHMTSAITNQSHTSHLVTYVEAADASKEINGSQLARLNGRNLFIIAIGERKVDGVGATEVESVVR